MCTNPLYHPAVVPEAPLEHTEAGLVPRGKGWFVLNAREARWRHREERGERLPFEGRAEFAQVGVSLYVLAPGEPIQHGAASSRKRPRLTRVGQPTSRYRVETGSRNRAPGRELRANYAAADKASRRASAAIADERLAACALPIRGEGASRSRRPSTRTNRPSGPRRTPDIE